MLFNGVRGEEPDGDEPVVVVEFDNLIGKDELEKGSFGVVTPGEDPEGEDPEGEVPDGEKPDGKDPDGDDEGDDLLVPKPGQVDATHLNVLRNFHISRCKLLHTQPATAAEYRPFTDSKILYLGIVFHNWYDRDRFNRCFNACMFDITQTQVLSFMFRNIRYSLRRDNAWTQDKKLVLIRQFKAEFNFDYEAHQVAGHDICDCERFGEAWNVSRCSAACKKAQLLVGDAFRAKGIDQILTEMEAKHWILRVWRRHRRGRPRNWDQTLETIKPLEGGSLVLYLRACKPRWRLLPGLCRRVNLQGAEATMKR